MLEAFTPTAYLVPGTLGVVAAGGFVQAGKLNAPATFLVVWLGVIIGDLASYFLARKFGDMLRRWETIAGALSRAESRLQRHPVAFILLSHFSPFLKNASAPAAGLMGWTLRRFLPLEIVASLLDSLWFLTLGYIVSRTVGSVTAMPVAARIVSAVALIAIVGFFIGRGRKCAVPRTSPSSLRKTKRRFGFFLKVLLLLGPWEVAGRLAKHMGAYERPDYRAALVQAIEMAQPGDAVLVGRDMAAPWGDWSHIGLVVETPAGKALLHSYEEDVRLTGVKSFPMTSRVAIARLNCTEEQRQMMIAAAWKLLGTKFKLGSRKPDSSVPSTLNCVGLVDWAAAQAGIKLNDIPAGGVVTPDDVLAGGNAFIVYVWRDGNGPGRASGTRADYSCTEEKIRAPEPA